MLLKKLKNNLICIFTLGLLLCCQVVWAVGEVNSQVTLPKTATSASSLVPNNAEKKQVFNKFLVSMLWVFGSCFLIIACLLLYKKIASKNNDEVVMIEPDISQNLTSPDTVDEAAEFVIKKF